MFGRRKPPSTNPIRDTLFGDVAIDDWPGERDDTNQFPWSMFAEARENVRSGRVEDAKRHWRSIVAAQGLESRHYLQAHSFLAEFGDETRAPEAGSILGVVVEVALREGLDLLAVYADRTACYYNYSGAGVVWQHPDDSIDGLIERLFDAASVVVAEIGPWDGPRPEPPPRGQARVSFLTTSGLCFGQGKIDDRRRDPLAVNVMEIATSLMQVLTARTQ